MAAKKDIEYKVIEFYGNIRGKDDNWGITVTKMQWDDNPPTVNIRNTNLTKGIIGKGVSITDVETDTLVDVLLDAGYGTVDAIENALEKRRNQFEFDDTKIQAQYQEVNLMDELGYSSQN